jgi:hypothetical protein
MAAAYLVLVLVRAGSFMLRSWGMARARLVTAGSLLRGAVVAACGALALSACMGDPVKCHDGCKNVATLMYWKATEPEIAAAPVEQRAALRKTKVLEFQKYLDQGLEMCTTQCQSANDTEAIDCMLSAKTGEQAARCSK